MVGSSEYATICELCANVADIDNICGEVSPDTPLDEEAIDQMKSALGELIQYANDTLNTLK